MSGVRLASRKENKTCLGVISFYETPRPWDDSCHLSRLYEGMSRRADELGYRLETMWLRAPEMTPGRFRNILDARGIEGLLCFGSPNVDEPFPEEFDHYAIVTQGVSVNTACHRVVNNAYSDTQRVLNRVHQCGYRRPGLILSNYEDQRGALANMSAYLGWWSHYIGSRSNIPVLRVDSVEEKPVLRWLKTHRPDAIIIVHDEDAVAALEAVLKKNGVRAPADVGLAALTQVLRGCKVSGIEENQPLIGAWAVELLVARIMNRDFGMPTHPRIEMVEGVWIDGGSLRSR